MSIKLSPDQHQALLEIIEWYKNASSPYLTMGGFAGTGKTTLLAQFRKIIHKARPKTRVAFCAYTGKASRVLHATLKQYQIILPQDSVSTIHSLMYAPVVNKKGAVKSWKKKSSIKADLILLDEASMVDKDLWQDLHSFEIPILAVGDHGQLPPVNSRFNLMKSPQIKLERIHRQAADNPIIRVSQLARENGQIPVGDYGSGVMKLDRYDSSSGQVVEEMLQGRKDELIVLAGYNHTRVKLNQQIRELDDRFEESPQPGETVICLRNNWEKGIYNGMTGTLQQIKPKTDERGNHHWYEVQIALEDEHTYTGTISAHQFGELTTLKKHKKLDYKSLGDLFDFGYALTVHKAQGSQSLKVLLFEERNKHMSDDDWRRWLYTAVTRAQESLVIVGT